MKMDINWGVVIPYYSIAIIVVVGLFWVAGKAKNNILRIIVRTGVLAILLTPWMLVGEGVHWVPASIIAYYGATLIGWEEFVWGLTPILVVWCLLLVGTFIIKYVKNKLFKHQHAV